MWPNQSHEDYLKSLKAWRDKPENKEKMKQYKADWYQKHKEKQALRYHKLKAEKPEVLMLWRARRCAKEKGYEFNLTVDDIKIPDLCPILLIPVSPSKGKISKNSPVLDRIDNEKGYTKDNVRVISNKADILKSNMSKQDIERLYKYVSKLGEPAE